MVVQRHRSLLSVLFFPCVIKRYFTFLNKIFIRVQLRIKFQWTCLGDTVLDFVN